MARETGLSEVAFAAVCVRMQSCPVCSRADSCSQIPTSTCCLPEPDQACDDVCRKVPQGAAVATTYGRQDHFISVNFPCSVSRVCESCGYYYPFRTESVVVAGGSGGVARSYGIVACKKPTALSSTCAVLVKLLGWRCAAT